MLVVCSRVNKAADRVRENSRRGVVDARGSNVRELNIYLHFCPSLVLDVVDFALEVFVNLDFLYGREAIEGDIALVEGHRNLVSSSIL